MGTIFNQILDYVVLKDPSENLLSEIIRVMNVELNRRYEGGQDWYQFDGKKFDDKTPHVLKKFLLKHPKVRFDFKTKYSIPELLKE